MQTSNRIPRSPRSRSVGTRTANDRLCSRDRSERKRTFVVKLFVLVAITYINEISRPVMLLLTAPKTQSSRQSADSSANSRSDVHIHVHTCRKLSQSLRFLPAGYIKMYHKKPDD